MKFIVKGIDNNTVDDKGKRDIERAIAERKQMKNGGLPKTNIRLAQVSYARPSVYKTISSTDYTIIAFVCCAWHITGEYGLKIAALNQSDMLLPVFTSAVLCYG